MLHTGIKINRIFFIQDVFFRTNLHFEFSRQQVNKFHAGMLMPFQPACVRCLELGIKSVELALGRGKIQAVKEVGDRCTSGPFGKA